MLRLVFIFLVLAEFTPVNAQIDTEFWFAVPEITEQHADRPVFLRISTMDQPTVVSISIPANPDVPVITAAIPANSSYSYDLTDRLDYLETAPANAILNKGLYIKSRAEITAYYELLGTSNYGDVNCDIFTMKGKNALGKSFYIPLQNHWNNYRNIEAWSSFDIVATEDNTQVTIIPTRDIVGHPASAGAFTITLNKGQTYSARAAGIMAADHPSGSKVTSDKPVAITIKDDSMLEHNAWDTAGDQLIPENLTGTEYILIKASDNTDNTDRAFICATKNGTDVFINGSLTPAATLMAGETFNYQLSQKFEYIKTSQPVYINQIASFQYELGGAVLPSVNCNGSRRVAFTRPAEDDLVINLVVKSGGENAFKLNGKNTLIPASAFTLVDGTTDWLAAQIPVPLSEIAGQEIGIVTNDNADFQLSIYNGDDFTFRYGYFSDFAGLELGPDKTICPGESIVLNAGFGKTSYDWSTGAQTQTISVTDPGLYKVEITKGACVLKDSVNIYQYPAIGDVISGKHAAACANVGITIQTHDPYVSYSWSSGEKTATIRPAASGEYWVEVKNSNGCTRKDTIEVTLYPVPQPSISYMGELEKICWDSLITLQTITGPYTYKWNTGETTASVTTPHLPEYKVTVTDQHQCKDSTSLVIDCSPYVRVYNMFTPDGNGSNEFFIVENLKPGKWILDIYNRWGNKVYENSSYNNEFNGEGLSGGLYFYSLRHVEGKKDYKGWVHIVKE